MRSLPSVWEVFLLILCITRNVCVERSFEPKPPSVVNGRPRSEVDLETEKQLVLCAGQNKSLECLSPGSTISIQAAFWGRLSNKICPSEDGDPVTNCENDPATLRIVKGLCDEKRECGVSAKHAVLQAPGTKHCPGVTKYMEVNYTCMPEMKKFVLCDGETTLLHCGQGWKINILSVYWGRDSPATCPTPLGRFSSCGSTANSLQALKSLCQGREQCSVRADDEHFSLRQDQPHCPAVEKYAVIGFRCQPLTTDDNLAPSQTVKLEDNENNNSELAVSTSPLHKESVQLEQNQKQPMLSQPLHEGTYNITVLPIPQYDRNTSAKLAPLFAYLNGDKTGKKESSGPLPVPQDNHTTVDDKSGASTATSGHVTASNALAGADQSLSAASKSGQDSSPVKTQANEQMLRESANLSSAAQTADAALQKTPEGSVDSNNNAHDSQTPMSSGSSSGVLGDKSMNKVIGDKTGAHPSPTEAVTTGMGAQIQGKEPPTAQRLPEAATTSGTTPTKLTPQGTDLANGKLDNILQKQAKQLCLSQRHNCPTPVQSPRPSDSFNDKLVPEKQASNSDDEGDAALEEKNKAHWGVMIDLAKQIQKTNNEAETVKTLNEKVHTLEVLSNALTTLTSKYFLEANEGNEDGSSREHSQRKLKAHRHHKPHQEEGIANSKVNLLGSLLEGEEERLLVPKHEKSTAESRTKSENFLLPKEVDTLQNKINQAIEAAEASNRQSVSRHPQNSGMLLRHLAGEATKGNNAYAREVSAKLMPQHERREGTKDVDNFNVIIKKLAKKAVEKERTNGQRGQPLESIVRNVTLLQGKSLQDSGDGKGGRFDSLVGRDARGPAKEKGGAAGEQVRNMTKANTTMVLTATNTVITPSRGITLGGRINTETQIKQAPQGIGEKLLKAMGSILSRHNKTDAKSSNCLAQGRSNCVGASSNSKHLPQGEGLRNGETPPFKLKPGKAVQTTPFVGGQREAGNEQGVKYTNVKTLHPGKRLAVRSDKFKKNLETMTDLEEGIEKLITKLPNDHRQSDLPKSEALPGTPTDRESGENSPNNAVKLLQNIAVQLRKTVYLLDKTKAAKATRSGEQQMEKNTPTGRMPSDNSPALKLQKHRQERPFADHSLKTHVVRERAKTQNAWGTSLIPHVVEFHSGVTMGRIAGLGESKVSDTSLKDASLLSEDKITNPPQFSHALSDKVMGENNHRLENVNLGGAILSGVDKNLASSQPTASPLLTEATNSDKNGLLPVPQFSSFANWSQAGLATSTLGPIREAGNGTAQEGTTQLSVTLSREAGKGEQQAVTSLAHSSTEVKELLQGISNLVKLLSRNGKSEAKADDGEGSDQQTSEATSESMPITESDNEYPTEQRMSPDMLATNQNDESEPEGENAASDEYTLNLNSHYVTPASANVADTDSHFNSPNSFKIDEVGGHYTEYKDDYSDDGNYGNDAYENHVEDDVTGGDIHSNYDGYVHTYRQRKPSLSNLTDARVDPLTDYHPTKKSPLVEEYESLPSQIRDLDDPRLKDNRVLDYVEGMIDKENADETTQLMDLRPKMYKGTTARKSKISHGGLAAALQKRKRRKEKSYQVKKSTHSINVDVIPQLHVT